MEKSHVLAEIRAIFKQIPDLERLVGKYVYIDCF